MRPSKEQVDEALRIIEASSYVQEYGLRIYPADAKREDIDQAPDVLAAEVRALRETEQKFVKMLVYVEQLEHNHGELEAVEIGALRAIISRVRALPNNWRACASTVNDPSSPSIFVECAEELERVLNDE